MQSRDLPPGYRIAVIGSGAVGGFYGARLAHLGREVCFLMRSDLAHVREKGLHVYSEQGDFHLQNVSCFGSAEEIGPVDLVLIAVKTTSNDALLGLLPPLLKKDAALLTLQNGLGSDEFVAEHFGAGRVMGGLCFVCLNRTAPGVIHHIGEGRISLGEFAGQPLPRTHDVCSEFKRAGVACSVKEDLARERWRKLVWNVPFNGLSIAGGGIDVAQILADEDLLALTHQLMREVIGAAGKLGFDLPESMVEEQIRATRGMGAYKPSSLIDYLEGREVEVESIWGEPLRRGLSAGAEVGHLDFLYRQIRRLCRMR